ncbi:MAG: nickel-dependent lactate racemase [Thermoguttaceae bacterium]
MKIELSYGRGTLAVEVPDKNLVKVLGYKPLEPLADPEAEVAKLLAKPTGAPPLMEIAAGKKTACILISDITRPVPNETILRPVLKSLEASGLLRENILILVATGLHRPSTAAERVEMCGEWIVENYRIEDNHAREQSEHTYLCDSPNGVPVWIDTRYLEADLKIITGLIEPHFMAGFSGGRKAICPGICGQETIAAWHKPRFLEHERAANGCIDGNPVHVENTWIAKKAGCDFLVNVVLNHNREVLRVVAGDMETAWEDGVNFTRTFVVDTVPEPVDVVITSGAGYPLDTTYYQSVKGVVAALNILKPGGTIIIASSCTEGLGSKEFDEIANRFPNINDFIDAIVKDEFFVLNQWQMEELGKALRKGKVKFYTAALSPETLRKFYVEPVPDVETAIAETISEYGPDTTIAVLPEGPYVLAEVDVR